jgi:hypothetical protein
MKKLIFILLTISKIAFSQSFVENSIGVVYLVSEKEKEYDLKIVFPMTFIENFEYDNSVYSEIPLTEFEYNGNIKLFDEYGVFDTLTIKEKFIIKFWCENDGGIQYRPELNLKIKKEDLSKRLSKYNEIQNISCFAIVNQTNEKRINHLNQIEKNDIRLKGRIENKNWVAIWVEPDDAMNCDGNPPNNLMIYLYAYGQNHRIRCCGP